MGNPKKVGLYRNEKIDITGCWSERRVWVGLKELLPDASQKVYNHSPDGFNWSYGGSGPAQLALAILLDVTQNQRFSVNHYQDFKWEIIALLPKKDFILSLEVVKNWIDAARAKDADPS